MNPLELALQAARHTPFPGVWGLTQGLAAAIALGYVGFRTRRWSLVACFALALPAGVLGAFALGLLYRLLDRLRGEDADLIGLALYGALVGIAAAFAYLAKRRGLPALASLDLIAPALALLIAVGRLGCFLAGCDAGAISTSPLSLHFPQGSAVFRDHVAQGVVLTTDEWSLAVHPTQLYEAALAMALAYLGHQLSRLRLPPGVLFAVTALGYALVRSFSDALRLPAADGVYGLVTSLLVSIAAVVLLRQRLAAARTHMLRLAANSWPHGQRSGVDTAAAQPLQE
jgi:hypothetical protein